MLAFAHHVPDVAEHEQVAGDRARQAGDIVGVPGHKPGGEALCKMRRRIFFRDGLGYASRQLIGNGNVLFPGELDKAVGKIGIVCGKCRLDIRCDDGLVVPQSGIELDVGERSGIVLRRQNGAGVARMRPQQRAGHRAHRGTNQSRSDPHPLHPKNPDVFASLEMVCRF